MSDAVNHPDHYKAGEYECIKVMREVYGDVAFRSFCILNAFKYLWRQGKKGPLNEDVEKAKKYLGLAPETWDARELLESYNALMDSHNRNVKELGAAKLELEALQFDKLWAETRIKQLTEQVVELKRSLRKKTRKGKTNG